jgi:hypothetical protein
MSPFFNNKHNPVVAPHPSELPLPSLSFTPHKNVNVSQSEGNQNSTMNNTDLSVSPVTSQNDIKTETYISNKISDTTPSKRCKYNS